MKLRPRIEPFLKPITTNVRDDVTLAQLNSPEFEFMQGIFHLAELWNYKDIIFSQDATTSKLLDDASDRLTAVMNEKWNQGRDLVWKLMHSGSNGDHILIQIKRSIYWCSILKAFFAIIWLSNIFCLVDDDKCSKVK